VADLQPIFWVQSVGWITLLVHFFVKKMSSWFSIF